MALQETFLLSCDVCSWSLVTGPEGTGLLTSIVLSRSRSSHIGSFLSRPSYLFSVPSVRSVQSPHFVRHNIAWKFRLVAEHLNEACLSSLISKCDNIPVRPNVQPGPYPFSRLEVWNFADDATKIVAVDPVICSPGSRSPLRRLCRPRRRDLCPPIPIISRAPTSYYDGYQFAIVPNNPGFFIQFQSETTGAAALDDPEEPWAYCVNHTTPTKASIPMCMGVVSRSSTDNSSVVPAGLRYCPDITNCPNVVDSSMVPPANILILNMTI
jgi:hypothetical protein